MKLRHIFGIVAMIVANAAAQEIGYIEEFALSTNRAEALRDLVPGTDEYFYFHALNAQNTGQRAEFQELLDRWIRERNGTTTGQARELLDRQALLDYGKTHDQTIAYLKDQLNPFFGHARKTGERRSDAPTRLDPNRIAVDTLLTRALTLDRGSLERIEDAGLELVAGQALATGPAFTGEDLARALSSDRSSFDRIENLRRELADGQPLTAEQRRNLLSRLQRPDYPGLVDLIIDDLSYRDSRGFGHHEIHRRLTLAQLDELLQKKPDLRNQTAFVAAYLSKLAP